MTKQNFVPVNKFYPLMRHSFLIRIFLLPLIAIAVFSCKKQTETIDGYDYDPERLKEVLPLEVGKYMIYRLDSLVFTNFQQNPEIHSYKVKHEIDAQITDNLGRTSYRVYTYTCDAAAPSENWQPSNTYFITPLENKVELIEDNLRVVKLQLPVKEGATWKGNSYLPSDPYGPFGYNFSNDDDMKNWEFYFDTPEPSLTIDGHTYADVYTVEQQDDYANVPIVAPQSYAYKTRSVEKYAKGIGLVYREFALWEYQPLSGPNPFYTGFAITMWMIDHN